MPIEQNPSESTLPPRDPAGTAAQPPDPHATIVQPLSGESAAASGSLDTIRYFGDYELLAELARGGMGVVYKARQVSLNRLVAVKMILSRQLASDEEVVRFRAEAEVAANLDHPNILPIYEVGEHQGQQYFAMKLVAGGSLSAKVKDLVADPKRAVTIMTRVSRAVHFAHQRGILHRDLKPANVLLDEDSTTYVTDFGLAKKVEGDSGMTQSGAIVGTPSYMAPEQARAEKHLTTGADIYSLGAIVYELLTGRPPFRAATVMDTLLKVLETEPDPPLKVNPKAERDLSVISLKCLAKEPGRRYGSAEALADDLDRWGRGEPILARPVGRSERAGKWMKRNPVVTGLLAAVLLLFVGGTAGIYVKYRDAETARTAEAKRVEERDVALALGSERQKDLTYQLGVSNFLLANAAYENKDMSLTRDRLSKVPAEQRKWEWHYLTQQSQGGLFTFHGHTSPLTSIAYSPDGTRVVTGSTDKIAKVWNARTGMLLLDLVGHTDSVLSVSFSPDGKRVITGSSDKSAKVWDTRTGTQLLDLKGHTRAVRCVAYNLDGAAVATGGDDAGVKIWDAKTGTPLLVLNGHATVNRNPDGLEILGIKVDSISGVNCVVFSPDGSRILSCGTDKTAKVWDARNGTPLLNLQDFPIEVRSVAFSPDGSRIVTGCSTDCCAKKETFSGVK